MTYNFKPHGVCSREIQIELDENDRILSVEFIGGCDGNLCGIGKLVKGRTATEVSELLRGTTCGPKSTSCPDQLAIALTQALCAEAQQAK